MKKYSISLAAVVLVFSITVNPSAGNYGNVAVNGFVYKKFTVGGLAAGDSAQASITGPDASSWYMQDGDEKCYENSRFDAPCTVDVTFRPRSKGAKRATLVIRDFRGGTVSAPLTGTGVDAVCEMKVVFCNYAHLYKGVFSWNDVLRGPAGSTEIVMQADIDGLVVVCNGTETFRENGQSKVLTSTGKGLVAVEFKLNEQKQKVYNITVACPTPGDSETPSQPAELGHFDQQTYDQLNSPASVPVVEGMDLVGSSDYPNPANDAVNGVTGTVVVRWNLKRK